MYLTANHRLPFRSAGLLRRASRRFFALLLSALTVGPVLWITDARAAEVEALLLTCLACHNGNGVPINRDVPIIAGQPFTVINDALMLFANGERPCTSMCAMVSALSSPEKIALANDLELQAFIPAKQEFDPALAQLGAKLHEENGCEDCHS